MTAPHAAGGPRPSDRPLPGRHGVPGHHSADVSHIEVRSTHFTLGLDPDVWEIVAMLLDAAR